MLFILPAMHCKKQDTVAPREGLINFTIGDVKIVSTGGEQLAKVGDAVKEGMKIVTKGDKSQAKMSPDQLKNLLETMKNSPVRRQRGKGEGTRINEKTW